MPLAPQWIHLWGLVGTSQEKAKNENPTLYPQNFRQRLSGRLTHPCRLPSPRPRLEKRSLLSQQPLSGPGLCSARSNSSAPSKHIAFSCPSCLCLLKAIPSVQGRVTVPLPSWTFRSGFLLCPVPLPHPADPCSLIRLVCSSHPGLWMCSSPEQRAHVGGLWPNIIYLSGLLWQQTIVVTCDFNCSQLFTQGVL